MIIKKTNRKYLYLKFFNNYKNKMVEKSTGLIDNNENRLHLTNEVIPELQKQLKGSAKAIVKAKRLLEDYINIYLKIKENLATYCDIEAKSKVILKYFGNIDVTSVTPLQCKEFILGLEVSTKTKRNYLNVLKGIFDIANEDMIIKENPTRFIKLIKTEAELGKDDIEPFSKQQVELLLNTATGKLKDFLGISFYTGARPGELLALKVQDIDFINNTISITKQYTKGKLKNSLKTSGSKRVIPLFAPAMPYFQNLIEDARDKKSFHLFSKDSDNTKLYSIDNIRGTKSYGVYSKLLEKCNIEYRKIYQTRHTFIVNMLNTQHVKITDIAQIVGHSSTQMIMTVYAKFIKGEQLKINRNIDIFNQVDTLVDSRHNSSNLIILKSA